MNELRQKCALIVLNLVTFLACNSQSTDEFLSAEFLTSGQNVIEIVSPAENTGTSLNPTLAWSLKPGINLYKIEISTTADFSKLVLAKEISSSSYTLANSDLIGLNELDTVEYHWRVSAARLKTNLVSKRRSLQVLGTKLIYVDVNSSSSLQIGNRSAPMKTIQSAINLANLQRNFDPSLPKDILVATGTYNEDITLKAGISLFGGYESVGWTRNIPTNITTVLAKTDAAINGQQDITTAYTATTAVDGFTIQGGSITGNTYGFYLISASPTIANNIIFGGSPPGSGSATHGIYQYSASAKIINNIIDGGRPTDTNSSAYGIYNVSASPLITNNTINGGSRPAAVGNIINAIANYTSTPTITNNILFITGNGTTRRGFVENDASSNPYSFENNLITQTGASLYYDDGSASRTLESELNVLANTTEIGPTSGNLGPATVATSANVQFVSTSDLHLTASTPTAIRNGGKDTSQNTCGLSNSSSCGQVTRDRDGKLRTVPFSMGAYEQD